MHIRISHLTEYHYDAPVEFSLQRLRLTPMNFPGQNVISWKTSVDGAAVEAAYDDHFGNRVELVSPEPNGRLISILAEGEIETSDRHGVFGPHQGFVPLWLYLRETPLTRIGKHGRDIVRKVSGDGELEKMHRLMALVHEAVAYMPGETGIATTAEQALEQGAGVCQDHAHVFIACARAMGIPARYVSGYLLNGDTQQTASHAWAEAHVSGLGWVGFDAANGICPGENYIRMATGLDYSDAAPISGMRNGSASEIMKVAISIEARSQSQS
jgi:transglutaminase-like putative cysteine protease